MRFRVLRDVLGALAIFGLLIGGLSVATDGAWPPMLVVESGSMMHRTAETSYGRIGTVDVGDIVFMRATNDPVSEVELWVEGGKDRYGRPGHIIVFDQDGNAANTSILHRAITYVEIDRLPEGGVEYSFLWIDGEVKRFGREGIYFPPLGFDENFGFTPTRGYRPAHEGFITKGDNSFTNPAADQALGITRLVDASWVQGTVHGEVPWIGLARLALQTEKTNPAVGGWERVGNAYAPVELWTMFFLVVAAIVLVPFSIDTRRAWVHERERRRQRALLMHERAQEERRQVEFQPVLRKPLR